MRKFIQLSAIAGIIASTTTLSMPVMAEGGGEGDNTALKQMMFKMQQQVISLSKKLDTQQLFIENQQSHIRAQDAKIEQYSSLVHQKVAEVDQKMIEQLNSIIPAAGDDEDGFEISFKPSPKISSNNGSFSFQPFGRLQMDYTFFADDNVDNADNANFRRARLGAKGKVAHDWGYKFEIDFAGEAVNFKDVYLAYNGLDNIELRAGSFKPFFGLEESTSANYIQFIERAGPIAAFTKGEILGVGLLTNGNNWSFATGVFNDDSSVDSSDDEAWSVNARATIAPVLENNKILHLGLAVDYSVPDAASDSVRLRARPETGKGSRYVDTGTIVNVDSVTNLGVELAAVLDSLSVQGEYFNSDVSLDAAGSDPSFSGWYAQVTYLLTGESRPYSATSGKFNRIKPSSPFRLGEGGGSGAWEVAARYSNTDLNDAGAGVLGGEMENWTLGVNWYLNNNARLMANYVSVDTDENAAIPSDNPGIFELRASVDF